MKNYSFQTTTTLVNGVEITGFAEGDDVIQMGRLEDSAQHKVGVDGEMSVAINASRAGRVLLRLMQTSESNTYLTALSNVQENGVFVPIYFQFKDLIDNELISGTSGYLKRPADMTRGAAVTGQEWEIILERLDFIRIP